MAARLTVYITREILNKELELLCNRYESPLERKIPSEAEQIRLRLEKLQAGGLYLSACRRHQRDGHERLIGSGRHQYFFGPLGIVELRQIGTSVAWCAAGFKIEVLDYLCRSLIRNRSQPTIDCFVMLLRSVLSLYIGRTSIQI